MKNQIKIAVLVAVVILAFISFSLVCCTQSDNLPGNNDTGLLPEKITEVPPERRTFKFDNYQDFLNWITNEKSSSIDPLLWGKDYVDYISEINDESKNNTPLYLPFYKDKMIELRQKEGFSGIAFMTSELYTVPWVWYFVTIDGHELIIKCACLAQKDFERVSVQKASVAVKNFSRSAPNIDNYKKNKNYQTISEKTINFSGESVSALYYELTNDSRVSLQFAFDNTMVIITGEPETINSTVINSISLKSANIR